MGLLQKAAEQTSHSPETRKSNFPEIKKRLLQIKHRIEFYPTLFKELVDLFAIEKGALLIREGEIFTLSAIIGFDETTKNRLRMNIDEYILFSTTGKNEILQKYFSIREFVTIEQIQLVPFTNKNNIEGILLVTDYKTQKIPLLEEINMYAQQLEQFFNDNPLLRLKNAEVQSSNIKESITSYLQKIKNADNRVILLKLNLNDLISKIRENDSFSTSSNISNSAIRILSSFSKNRGRVFSIYNNEILITLLDKSGSMNIMVIQQQISSAFKSIFSNTLNGIDLNFESLIWKNNSLETILDHFIQDEVN